MLGVGTKPDIFVNNTPSARVLDVSRLAARAGLGPLTGIDRVERAYMSTLLASDVPAFALVGTAFGFLLLNSAGLSEFTGMVASGGCGNRNRTLAILRALAISRCTKLGLKRMWNKNLPPGATYLNVGHENLTRRVFGSLKSAPARIVVMIHDTLPLDFPEYQSRTAPAKFESKLRNVREYADMVIYNSAQSQQNAEHHFANWGPVPPGIVAHLGIDSVQPDESHLPVGLNFSHPYFIIVGTIEPRKNHKLLLDVWAEFRKTMTAADAPHLIIAGRRGWNNKDLFRQLDRDTDMGRSIHEISDIDDMGIAALMQGACGLLFPSYGEGFGLPAVEAASLGIPVVCNNLAIFHEILGDYPVYVSTDDCYAWAEAIGKLTSLNKTDGFTAGRRNSPLIVQTWENHFSTVLNLV